MTLLRDVITIPLSVSEGDFVVRAAEGADLGNYVVTDQLKDSFVEALKTVEHACSTGRSQAKFLHGSFGSGKSHFMAVLREILHHNRQVRTVPGLDEVAADTDRWLPGKKILTLTFHMLDAKSVEQAVLQGYLDADHRAAPRRAAAGRAPVGRAARRRGATCGSGWVTTSFFAAFAEAGARPRSVGWRARRDQRPRDGWTADSYDRAAAAPPGTPERDSLVSALDDHVLQRRGAQRRVPRPRHRARGDHPARQGARLRRDGVLPRRTDPVAVDQDQPTTRS